MKRVLTAEAMRNLDAHIINETGTPGSVLMENAAHALFKHVLCHINSESRVLIICGKGNNGGDGLALLRILHMNGVNASAALLCEDSELKGDAAINIRSVRNIGLPCVNVKDEGEISNLTSANNIIVDAIFGTGLSRNVTGLPAKAIESMNKAEAYRIAVDIPSGICSDTGKVLGIAFKADATVTFQHLKRGLILFPGREYSGKLEIAPIGMNSKGYKFDKCEYCLEYDDIVRLIPKRLPDSHKGSHGRALLIAGSEGFFGASVMSARATLRAGAGLLKVVVPGEISPALFTVPEAMVNPMPEGGWDGADMLKLDSLIDWADCIAVGPGMGRDEGVKRVVSRVLQSGKPSVLDADALNAISGDASLYEYLHPNSVLTPHAGEMARLCACSALDVKRDPVGFASMFSKRWNANLLLKGATSVICSSRGNIAYNLTGNPGLAKGGSGDVLTGIILAMMAQGLQPFEAACAGAYLLGKAADKAAETISLRAITSSDVVEALKAVIA